LAQELAHGYRDSSLVLVWRNVEDLDELALAAVGDVVELLFDGQFSTTGLCRLIWGPLGFVTWRLLDVFDDCCLAWESASWAS
jgi:hypothetical protein